MAIPSLSFHHDGYASLTTQNQQVTIKEKDFSSFSFHFSDTIEEHLKYTEDDYVTETTWNDLKMNGFTDSAFHSVEIDQSNMTLGYLPLNCLSRFVFSIITMHSQK